MKTRLRELFQRELRREITKPGVHLLDMKCRLETGVKKRKGKEEDESINLRTHDDLDLFRNQHQHLFLLLARLPLRWAEREEAVPQGSANM